MKAEVAARSNNVYQTRHLNTVTANTAYFTFGLILYSDTILLKNWHFVTSVCASENDLELSESGSESDE